MSRIGKLPITLPKGVEVKLGQDIVEVKGPKGSLTTPLCGLLDYEVTAEKVTITRKNTEDRATAQQHGLRRTLLANCVEGVTKGFSKTMEVIGVGYKVAVKGNIVELALGFSHPVIVELPKGIEAKAEGTKLTISGIDKQLVGEMCAKIRRLRMPEPYKGKGIKYENEIIRRKAGKSGAKGK
ncbi:MAG: 50S ribosomal protein L6 [Mailhella sp.]|jgi:ribosomal protein L6, bacterial type|nr:50S ribosomal protein L6 [Mailhella sp.]